MQHVRAALLSAVVISIKTATQPAGHEGSSQVDVYSNECLDRLTGPRSRQQSCLTTKEKPSAKAANKSSAMNGMRRCYCITIKLPHLKIKVIEKHDRTFPTHNLYLVNGLLKL